MRLGQRPEAIALVRAGFPPAVTASATAAWRALERGGLLHPEACMPDAELPGAFAETLAAALLLEDEEGSGRAELLRAHYLERMPRMRVEQLATRAEPNATLLHTRLDLARLPRLAGALGRLYQLLEDAGVDPGAALPAPTPAALIARCPTLARLHAASHYGGFMPLLYGTAADLARAGGELGDPLAAIDRFLTAPILHELTHLGRHRHGRLPLYLDECVSGWLGVRVHPAFGYPAAGEDDGLYATPWFAQVGQALARVVGLGPLVRAHAGVARWEAILPAGFLDAARALAEEDYRERRGPHFLSESFRPAPWLKLIFGARGLRRELDAIAWSSLPPAVPPDDADELDEAIVADALRAMALENLVEAGAYRVRSRPPPGPVVIDVAGRCVTTAPRPGSPDGVAPSYLFPPAFAARLEVLGITALSGIIADPGGIPEMAAVLRRPEPSRMNPWRASFC